MEANEYDKISQELLEEAHEIETSKRPAYTIGSSDVFQNFKSIAARTNQSPLQVLCTYWLKHVDSITAFFSNPDIHQAEPIRSRFADCINYLKLGYALSEELRTQEQARFVQLPQTTEPGDVLYAEDNDYKYGFVIDHCENYVYQCINSKSAGKLASDGCSPVWKIAPDVMKEQIKNAVAYLAGSKENKPSRPQPGDLYVRYHSDLLYHFLVEQVVGDEACGTTAVREVGVDIEDAEMYLSDTVGVGALQSAWSKADNCEYLVKRIREIAAIASLPAGEHWIEKKPSTLTALDKGI